MKTNCKLALATIIGFVAGVVAGFFFSGAEIAPNLAQGDISKVSKFSRNVVSPAMSAFQEKITSNSEELQKTTFSLTVLTSRMTEFDELVKIATTASEDNEELAASLKNLQSLSKLAANARENGTQALEALNAIAEGKKTPLDYEQASQNLALAFLMVDRQISVGKQYVCDVDTFLRGKEVEDYKELALARDLWASYCAGEAVLTNNDEELAYWSKQQSLLTSGTDVLAGYVNYVNFDKFLSLALQQCIELDSAIGLDVNNSMLSNKEQFKHMDSPIMKSDMISNNEQFNTVVGKGEEMMRMNGGISQTINVDQMILNAVPDMGGVILTVTAPDAVMPQTREHILL